MGMHPLTRRARPLFVAAPLHPDEIFLLVVVHVQLALECVFEGVPNAPRQMYVRRRHHSLIAELDDVDDARQRVLCVCSS